MRGKINKPLTRVWLLLTILLSFTIHSQVKFYSKSYALVIGINKYPSPEWRNLDYAIKDARGMADFLKRQGFEVTTLYDNQATKKNIISKMQDYLAHVVKKQDRVLIFFSGHGYTENLGGKDWGYIVPYDAAKSSASYLSMEELKTLSQKMGNAKHQLFIMDSCYGGLLGMKGGGVDTNIPYYLQEVTRRKARQIITAGGKNQQVVDGGPKGYSYFTGYLLEALNEGMADLDGDGYITFKELSGYLLPRASSNQQTPATSTLYEHEAGEFVFTSPKGIKKVHKKDVVNDNVKGKEPPGYFEISKNIDRTDAKSTAEVILEAYRVRGTTALKEFCLKGYPKTFAEIIQKGKNHPEYDSLFSESSWRWQMVRKWDGNITEVRYRDRGQEALAKFSEMGMDAAAVRMVWQDSQWWLKDITSIPRNNFESFSKTRKYSITLTASLDNPNPVQYSAVTISIFVSDQDNKPVIGAKIIATAYYKSVDRLHSTFTDQNGEAKILFKISRAAPGYKVTVKVVASKNGLSDSKELFFTPKKKAKK